MRHIAKLFDMYTRVRAYVCKRVRVRSQHVYRVTLSHNAIDKRC